MILNAFILHSVFGFVKRRSRKVWSKLTTDTFLTDKADVGQAGMFSLVTAEGLVRA